MYKWQRGLTKVEHLDGVPGQPGATTRLAYRQGNRYVQLIETITHRDLPDAFDGTCATKGVVNAVRNRFVELEPGRMRWIGDNQFRLSGVLRWISWLLKPAFVNQTRAFFVD